MRAGGGVCPESQTFGTADVYVRESLDKNGRNAKRMARWEIPCALWAAVKGFESTGKKVHFNLRCGCTRH